MSDSLKFGYKRLAERLDKMTLRERVLIFTACVVGIVFVLGQLLIVPRWDEQRRLQAELQVKRTQIQAMQAERQQTAQSDERNLDEENKARLTALNARLQSLDPGLAGVTRALVSPKEMARLLEDVLHQNTALQVVRVESLTPEPLVERADPQTAGSEAAPAAPDAAPVDATNPPAVAAFTGFYKHGMRVEVRGRYADIVNYLHALEGLRWKVFWGQVNLETETYPISHLTLVVYTLSLRQSWIGI
jgi:MSHA biogenesis protein MshJ